MLTAAFSSAVSTVGGSVALFVLTEVVMVIYTVVVLMQCPYHRKDRWQVTQVASLFIITLGAACMNLTRALDELGYPGMKEASAVFGRLVAIGLVAALAFVLVAFLLLSSCSARLCWRKCSRLKKHQKQGHQDHVVGKVVEMPEIPTTSAEDAATPRGTMASNPMALRRIPTQRLERKHGDTLEEPTHANTTVHAQRGVTVVEDAPVRADHRIGHRATDVVVAGGGDGDGGEGHSFSRVPPNRLSLGWDEYVDPASGCPYYHNVETNKTTFDHPGWADVSSTAEPLFDAGRVGGARNSLEEHDALEEERAVAATRFVRWKARAKTKQSTPVGDLLLGDGHVAAACPNYLSQLMESIFKVADTDGDGSLTTIELSRMLRARAKGTALDGDAHAIFSLNAIFREKALASESDDIGPREFCAGILQAISDKPNGHVAEWILKEVCDEAACWSKQKTSEESSYGAGVFYVHAQSGASQWVRPGVLVHLEGDENAQSVHAEALVT